jgi:hypothetical protein
MCSIKTVVDSTKGKRSANKKVEENRLNLDDDYMMKQTFLIAEQEKKLWG